MQENTHTLLAPPCLLPDPTGSPEPGLAAPLLVPTNPSTQTHLCKAPLGLPAEPRARVSASTLISPQRALSPPQPLARGDSSDACYFCGLRVYILERASAEGRFFHRSCFQCQRCGATLRLGDYGFDERDGEWALGEGAAQGQGFSALQLLHGFGHRFHLQVIFTAQFTTPLHPAWTCSAMSPWCCLMG